MGGIIVHFRGYELYKWRVEGCFVLFFIRRRRLFECVFRGLREQKKSYREDDGWPRV